MYRSRLLINCLMQYTFVMEFEWLMIVEIMNQKKKKTTLRKNDVKSIWFLWMVSTVPYMDWISVLHFSFSKELHVTNDFSPVYRHGVPRTIYRRMKCIVKFMKERKIKSINT